jgi:hypothetical protein
MRLPPAKLLKVMVMAYVPVVLTILIMIVLRANDLARENNETGLGESFFNPSTPEQAIVAGFIIWIIGAFFVAFLAVMLYHFLRTRLHVEPFVFPILTVILALLLTALLYVNNVPFAPEGAFEMLACGIGYGILVPIFYAREKDMVLYGHA